MTRGRPRNQVTNQVTSEKNITGGRSERRKRQSIEEFSVKLGAPARKGYVRRWVNDADNRIKELYDRDYEFVEEDGIETNSGGKRVSRFVGTKPNGDPMHAFLMEIPEKYHEEDQREKEARNRQVDDALRANRDPEGRLDPSTTYGKNSIGIS